jgi:histidine ammonia-lyase
MSGILVLDGRSLLLEDVERAATDPSVKVALDREARARVDESRAFIEDKVASGERVYGVTTGFGRLAEVVIAPEERSALQHNLVRSHASGMGRPFGRAEVRAIMLLRANALARGHSGCRLAVIERLLDLLNHGIHPRVPRYGSVGASGDLAPLAHVALGILGEGRAERSGVESDTAELLAAEGLEPFHLEAKEGLSLINGTQATTGLGLLSLLAAERAVETAEVVGGVARHAGGLPPRDPGGTPARRPGHQRGQAAVAAA